MKAQIFPANASIELKIGDRNITLSFQSIVKLSGVITLTLLGNCSNQQIYEAIYQSKFQACEEAPIQTQQACRDQYSLSFEDYSRARNQILAESDHN